MPDYESKDVTCPICYENPPLVLLCGHTYCNSCVQHITKCALCRAPINKNHIYPLEHIRGGPSGKNFKYNLHQYHNLCMSKKTNQLNELLELYYKDN
jgi:hypothetical protein